MDFLKRISTSLLSPFKENLYIFIFLLLFSSLVHIFAFSVVESLAKGAYIFLHHYVICYFLTLLYGCIYGYWRKVYMMILMIFLAINYLIDFFCIYVYRFVFDKDICAVVIGTNNEEAGEFIKTFFSYSLIIYPLLGLLVFWALFRLVKKVNPRFGTRFSVVCLMFVLVAYLTTYIANSKNWGLVSVGKIYTFLSTTTPPDLKEYYTHPEIENDRTGFPNYIVVVIGESLTKTHMSLYGYEKETSPYLMKLMNDSSLLVFSNVEAPAKNTVPAFKSIMSTYRYQYGDEINWYECTTLLEVMDIAGFETEWISNQSSKGWYDNVVAKYAALADTSIFVGNRFSPLKFGDYDGLILDVLPSLMDTSRNKFQIIHLMGNHYAFDKRYPAEYACFSSDDYEAYPEHQRYDRATYDNSVLYNDYVVGNIMDLYRDKDAIVFYFSDHSLDVYETSDDFVGHARGLYNDPIGIRIPFMVYMTDTYRTMHPEVYNGIKKAVDDEFNTEDFIYTIMDVVGLRFKENDDVKKNSCLNL